ncbi:MAG: hypothetical protein H3C35_12760 [Bacteroidetes bacterium]|nr:hypothetical protein [Bacteroidota bacterium]
MAKEIKKQKKIRKEEILSLEPINYKIIGAGLAVILLGYVALDSKPWDGVLALDVAPILLVLGYCVIVPFGIIFKKKSKSSEPGTSLSL